MGIDGAKQYDRTGSVPLYSKMQYGFRNKYGGKRTDDFNDGVRFRIEISNEGAYLSKIITDRYFEK